MPVYVDELFEYGGSDTFRWKMSAHMFATTEEELHRFARKIGLKRAWFQPPKARGSIRLPHYDLNPGRYAAAVKHGVIELDMREAREMWKILGFFTQPLDPADAAG